MENIKISVITPSIRPEGLSITQESLGRQTFKEFEWLTEIGLKKEHDLNKALNRMVKRATGELIVILQDYIRVSPDYLQKFWDAYKRDSETLYTAPVGKVDNLEYAGSPKWDWRAWTNGENNPIEVSCKWDCWEIDSACVPLKLLKEVGGFDEELDKFWSCDNVSVGCRADMAGFKFKNLFSNPSLAFDHDAFIEHPFRSKFNPSFNNERMKSFRNGLKINYL